MIAPAFVALFVLAAEPAPAIVPPSLVAPLDLPRALPMRRDVGRTVIVQLTIEANGTTRDVVLGPGDTTPPDLAKVVIDALTRATFQPATQDGKPIAVRITVPVPLGGSTLGELRVQDPRSDIEPTPVDARGIAGRVLERGTRRPVAGVTVTITVGSEAREVLTDGDGRFAFPDLPKGSYRVEVPFFDEPGARGEVSVPGSLTLRVTPDTLREYRTRVEGRGTTTSDATRVRVAVERAREVAGSSGDPLKVLEVLPGVARPAAAGGGAGELAVRGSGPEDTKFYIDGLPLPQLYHFGNIYSVLQDEWIDDIDFRAGGFSTEYGDALGGMVDVTLADLRTDSVHGHADVNVYHVAGLVTVPVSKDWTLGAAARRSWVDAILGSIVGDDVSFSTAPRYYDYQVRADYHPGGGRTRLKLLAFGSDDQVIVLGGGPEASDPDGSGFSLGLSFHQVQATADIDLADDLVLGLGLGTAYQRFDLSPGDNNFSLTFDPVTLRADLDWRASKAWRLRGGLLGSVARFNVGVELPRPTKEGQVQLPSEIQEIIVASQEGFTGRLDGWGEGTWTLSDEVSLSGGFRLASWLGNFNAFAPDLRFAVGWRPVDTTTVTLTTGLNHQAPAPDETALTIGNPDLSPERSAYVNLGLSQRLGEFVSVDLQGFYKSLDQLVVAGDRAAGAEPYTNEGTGSVFGGEALVRLQSPVVDAWVAYTLSRSLRVDGPGQPERLFSFDQTHVLSLVCGVQLGAGWRVGTRVRYATGNPYTPLEPAYFDAGADVWVPRAAGEPLSARSGAFFQLDLRVDKKWVFDTWQLDLYLELNNATNRGNIEQIQYSDDYQRRDDITSLPLTPSLGLRGSF